MPSHFLRRALPLGIALTVAGSALAQGHPHFDDKGTLVWSTSMADAKDAAKKADKMIFLEYGRAA